MCERLYTPWGVACDGDDYDNDNDDEYYDDDDNDNYDDGAMILFNYKKIKSMMSVNMPFELCYMT